MDLEAVPCPIMGERVYGTSDPLAIIEARKAETDGRTDFLEPPFWKPVALGLVKISTTTGAIACGSWSSRYEQELIVEFHTALAKQPTLVTWNGRGFDVPVLALRAMRYGLQLPNLHQTQQIKTWDSYRHRYGSLHVDLADEVTNYGAYSRFTLAKFCALLGIPCKQIAKGADVLAMIQAEDYETPKRYVLDDTIATARAFLRWRLSQSWLPVELCDALDLKLAEAQTALQPEPPSQLELVTDGTP